MATIIDLGLDELKKMSAKEWESVLPAKLVRKFDKPTETGTYRVADDGYIRIHESDYAPECLTFENQILRTLLMIIYDNQTYRRHLDFIAPRFLELAMRFKDVKEEKLLKAFIGYTHVAISYKHDIEELTEYDDIEEALSDIKAQVESTAKPLKCMKDALECLENVKSFHTERFGLSTAWSDKEMRYYFVWLRAGFIIRGWDLDSISSYACDYWSPGRLESAQEDYWDYITKLDLNVYNFNMTFCSEQLNIRDRRLRKEYTDELRPVRRIIHLNDVPKSKFTAENVLREFNDSIVDYLSTVGSIDKYKG